jgi:hypothetical protein
MPRLPEAIRASGDQTAICRTRDGDTVIVKRVTGDPDVSDVQESYAVSVRRAGQASQARFDVPDLLAARERLGELGLDPDAAIWQAG